jgi:hypothetical protein
MLYGDTELFNQNQGANPGSVFSSANVDELIKAISAGQQSGTVLDGQLTTGAALKYESLEATLKNLTFNNQHFVFYNQIAKKAARSTNEEYNQLVNYGRSGKYSILEGELPENTDSQYRRKSEFIKYKGIVGQVTDVIMQTNNQIDVYSQEVQNKMTLLLQSIENEMHYGDQTIDPLQFDGVYKLHKKAISSSNDNLEYFNSPFTLDVRGSVLLDSHTNELISNIVNQGYGLVTDIFAPPSVFTDYVDQKYDQRRIVTGAEVQAGKFGQKVTEFVTQFGNVMPNATIFGRRSVSRQTAGTTSGAQAPKAPAAITPDGVAPLAAVSDATRTKFGTDYAGDYFVAVAAVNQYGEGPLTALSASAVTVAATESIDMKFTITDNAYPATGFVIYRSEKDPATALADTPLYPVFSVSTAELTAGYDGGAAGLARDRNYEIPNTEKAFIYQTKNAEIMALKELGKMKKLDLAITSPTYRFAILYYLTQILYQPQKLGVLNNIGKLTS